MARLGDQYRVTPVFTQRLSVAYLCLVALAISSLGCGNSSVSQATKSEPEDTAKQDFDWAMERLQRALDTSGSVARLNLRVKREMSYELLPPDGTRDEYTARITIKTRSDYIPDAPITIKREEADAENELNIDPANEFEEDPTILLDTAGNSRSKRPPIVEPPTRFPKIEETKVYELAYLDKRWQLQTELESEHEQMWFDYSFQQ